MLPTSAASELAGDACLVAAVISSGSRWLGLPQGDLPELLGQSDRNFAARAKDRPFWVVRKQPEVGGLVCCLSGGVEASGRLLGIWRVRLDARRGLLEGVEEVWELGQILVCERLRCLWWSLGSVVDG